MKLGGLFLLCALASGISCGNSKTPEPFVFQMDWTPEAEFTGPFAAQDQGFFRDAGLTVTLVEGPAGSDVPGILTSGKADAAQMGMTMFLAAAQRDPDLIAVMTTLQTSSRVLMTRSDLHVKSPKDLEGLRVGIKSPSWESLVRKVMVNGGADPAKLVEVPVKASDIARFYSNELDVWTGFATSEPVTARLAGHPVNLLFADDFGAGGYDELIVVKRSVVQRNPDKYRRFLRALVQGWSWSADHGQEAVRLIDRWQPAESHEFHVQAWKALRPLVATGTVPIGWIEDSRWPGGAPFTTDFLEAR